MFSVAEEEVCRLLRSARELGRLTAVGTVKQQREEVARRVAAEVQAHSWLWMTGKWLPDNHFGGNYSEHDRQQSASPNSELQKSATRSDYLTGYVQWSEKLYSPLTPVLRRAFERPRIRQLIGQLYASSTTEDRSVSETSLTSESESGLNTLTYTSLAPSGAVQWIEFLKPFGEPFLEFDRSFVSSMLDDLDLTMPCAIPGVAVGRIAVEASERAADNRTNDTVDDSPDTQDLPKRQREVLELMLRGFSAKEIATELGISRHTVNDYSKSLYRHFAVSGRAELTALFIRSHPLRTPVAVR